MPLTIDSPHMPTSVPSEGVRVVIHYENSTLHAFQPVQHLRHISQSDALARTRPV